MNCKQCFNRILLHFGPQVKWRRLDSKLRISHFILEMKTMEWQMQTAKMAQESGSVEMCVLLKIIYSVYNWVAEIAPQGNKTNSIRWTKEKKKKSVDVGRRIDEPQQRMHTHKQKENGPTCQKSNDKKTKNENHKKKIRKYRDEQNKPRTEWI